MNAVLSVYLQMNLALAVGWILFLGAYRARRSSFSAWRRLAGWTIGLALLAPLGFAVLPQRALPVMRLPFPVLLSSESSQSMVARRTPRLPVSALPTDKTAPRPPFRPWQSDEFWLGLVLVVILAASLRKFRDVRNLQRLLRAAAPLKHIGAARIVVSNQACVPFSVRFKDAWVVLPESLAGSRTDLRIALAHELQHHRQGDTLRVWMLESLSCAFLFNPAVGAWRRTLTELQELTCDEALLASSRVTVADYLSCLMRVAETALQARPVPVGTTGMAADLGSPKQNQSFLRRRIEMLIPSPRPAAHGRAVFVLGTLIGLLMVSFAYGAKVAFNPDSPVNPGTFVADPQIQSIAEKVLHQHLNNPDSEAGFVVVGDPLTGRILAVANETNKGLVRAGHWALSERFESASVIKALVVAAAVNQDAVDWRESFDCGRGNYRVGKQTHHDHHDFDHLSAADTVVHSSNICGIRIGQKLGARKLEASFKDFGLGASGSASEFPQARAGRLPELDTNPDSQFIPQLTTGYSGLEVTSLEMLQAFGAIANGGTLMKPLARAEASPVPLRRVLRAEVAAQMRGVLSDVVERGTGAGARSELYTTAGKTGTGFALDFKDHPGFDGKGTVGHFLGFAPAAHPRLVVYALIARSGGKQTHGGAHAGPIFRDVTEQVLELMQVRPDKQK